jgi:tripartite-type tricarboxylate transporter receptor subunit TctC
MMQAKLVRAEYPESTVKVVVGFPPGQATDVVARFLSQKISENIPGSNFIVENKPGASGILGARIVAGSQPDGLTLMMGSSATLAVNPALYKDLPYDVKKDFAPIGLTVTVPLFMVVTPNFPAKTVQELVDMARKAPGTIDYGSGGSGVTNHLAMEMFKQAADIKMTHIPYKGGPAAITDLMAGRINVMFETSPAVLQHIKDGRLRALAVSSSKRASAAPEIPTIAESGFPGFEAVPWIGLVAPAGTPQPIIDKLSTISMKVLREKDFVAKLQGLGADPVGNTPAQFAAYIDAEMKRWAEAVKMSGAKID